MVSASGETDQSFVCGIVLPQGRAEASDALIAALADVDNLCLVLVGETAGLALPPTWNTVAFAPDFVVAPRTIFVGQGDADALFEQLSQRFGNRAIGVHLGSSPPPPGLLALVDAGGMTLAESGEYDLAMDMTGSVEQIAEAITALCRRNVDRNARVNPLTPQETREVCTLLRAATGHDFKHYKETTLSRRILRRIHVKRCDTFEDYLDLLKSSPDEARALMRDLLIGVTAFLRDPDAFGVLNAKVIAPLMSKDGPPLVRLWVAGCSTGPEAYSLAMLVREQLEAQGVQKDVQIFATDLDERALNVARKGVYAPALVEPLGPERVARYFTRVGGRYQVNKDLRQMIVFSPHNLIADPPFSRMDVITCRNVMIYLGSHLQKKLISVFHYALRDSGFLFLGASEAVTGHGDLFRVIDSRARIAQRKDVGVRGAELRQPAGNTQVPWQTHAGSSEHNIAAISQRIVLDEFAPPYLIVTEDGQITYASARMAPFLQMPEGQFLNNLIRVVRPGIRTGVRAAWAGALKFRRKTVHEGLTVDAENDRRRTRIVVQPMPDLGEETGTYMVVFFDLGAAAGTDALIAANPDSERLFADLEAELFQAREELEYSVQDLEGANEELKSSNEELLSMNEELQSANEELEASKEEIEFANGALEDANSDLVNLLSSTQIATIFLDSAGNLRRFTPAAAEFYNIAPGDVGRPLAHFTHRFADLPPMPDPSDIDIDIADEVEAVREDGRVFMRRVTPYRTEASTPSGIVVTFIDVTNARQAEQDIRASREQLRLITDHAPVMIAQINSDLRYTFVNSTLARLFGRSVDDMIGCQFGEAMGSEAFARVKPYIDRVLAGETVSFESEIDWHDGALVLSVNYAPEFDVTGKVVGFIAAIIDVTAAARVEKALLKSETRFRASQQASPEGFMIFRSRRDVEGRIADFIFEYANDASLRSINMTEDELVGQSLLTLMPGNKEEGLFDQYVEVVETGTPSRAEFSYYHEGVDKWFENTAVKVDDGFAVTFNDISERKEQERQIMVSTTRLRGILDSVVAFVSAMTPDGILREVNQPALDIANLTRDDVLNKPFWKAYWWDYDPAVQAQLRAAIVEAAAGTSSRYDVKVRIAPDHFIFIDFQLVPVLGADGKVAELVASGVDISDRLHAEDAVQQNAERLSRTLDGVSSLVGLLDVKGRIIDLNAVALAHAATSKTQLLGTPFQDSPWFEGLPESRDQAIDFMVRAAKGESCRADLLYRSGDGLIRRVDFSIVPILNDAGKAVGLVPCGTDITERHSSEMALAESRERLRLATRAARMGTFDYIPATDILQMDAQAVEVLGLDRDTFSAAEYFDLLDEPYRSALKAATMQGFEADNDEQIINQIYRFTCPDGTKIWIESIVSFLSGPAKRVVGTVQDITDRKHAEERQELLLNELNHRVKNSLATIQAMASHTLRHTESVAEFRDSFSGRLQAIARAHDILVGNEASGADLHQLMESQIGPYASVAEGQVVLNGPVVTIGAGVSHALGLIFHELATNAAKYGALSTETGVLHITWALLDDRDRASVRIDWAEAGGPPVTPPTRRGFGSRLIETTLSHSLDGRVALSYDRTGFRAELVTRLMEEDDV
jgi:two-component system CheB/CheR fusion protein